MKVAALVLGLVGALAVFVLGVMWAGQYQDLEKSELFKAVQGSEVSPEMAKTIAEVRRLGTAGYLNAGMGLLAFMAAPFVFKVPRVSGGIMAAAVLVPALLAPKSLVFSFLLLLAAVFAFLAKPGRAAAAA